MRLAMPNFFSAGRIWRLRIVSGANGWAPFFSTDGNT